MTADEDLLRLTSMVGTDFANGRNGVTKEGEGQQTSPIAGAEMAAVNLESVLLVPFR